MSGPGGNRISRRDCIKMSAALVGSFMGAAVGLPVIGFLLSPALKAKAES